MDVGKLVRSRDKDHGKSAWQNENSECFLVFQVFCDKHNKWTKSKQRNWSKTCIPTQTEQGSTHENIYLFGHIIIILGAIHLPTPQAVQTPSRRRKHGQNTRLRAKAVSTTHLCDRMMGLESACRTATAASALIKPLISSSTSDHSKWSSGSYLDSNLIKEYNGGQRADVL